MRKLKNNILPIVALPALLVLMWVQVNLFYFAHTHLDGQGHLVVHAHPYQQVAQQSDSSADHSHSRNELLALSFLFNVLSAFMLYVVLTCMSAPRRRVLGQLFSSLWIPELLPGRHVFRRGPPSGSPSFLLSI